MKFPICCFLVFLVCIYASPLPDNEDILNELTSEKSNTTPMTTDNLYEKKKTETSGEKTTSSYENTENLNKKKEIEESSTTSKNTDILNEEKETKESNTSSMNNDNLNEKKKAEERITITMNTNNLNEKKKTELGGEKTTSSYENDGEMMNQFENLSKTEYHFMKTVDLGKIIIGCGKSHELKIEKNQREVNDKKLPIEIINSTDIQLVDKNEDTLMECDTLENQKEYNMSEFNFFEANTSSVEKIYEQTLIKGSIKELKEILSNKTHVHELLNIDINENLDQFFYDLNCFFKTSNPNEIAEFSTHIWEKKKENIKDEKEYKNQTNSEEENSADSNSKSLENEEQSESKEDEKNERLAEGESED